MSLPSFVRRLGYVKPIEKGLAAFDPAAKPKAAPVAAAAPAKKEAAPADDDDYEKNKKVSPYFEKYLSEGAAPTITLTFCDRAENHPGMQKLG